MSYENSVKRRLKQQKLRRKLRRNEILVRRIFKLFRFVFLMFTVFCIYKAFHMHYWYFPSNIYGKNVNERIEIKGNIIVPSERIIAEMKKIPTEHKPIYKINPAKTEAVIEKLSPVKKAYIRRFWFPARYSVFVQEYVPALVIAPDENAPEVLAFSIEGRIITKEYLPIKAPNPSVKILSYGNNGDDYNKWKPERIEELYKLAKQIEEYAEEKVIYIDLRTPHNAFVKTESALLRLGETDVSLKERIKRIRELLPKIKEMKNDVLYGDLSWKDSVYIKTK